MRIVSLLPSATEIVYALGLEDRLVGVSCDCDHPTEVRAKPVVSTSSLDASNGATPGDIDAAVRTNLAAGDPIYKLDDDLIRELQPDLILAQDLCRVCAVPSGHVTEALETLGCDARVISLDPSNLDDVLAGIEEVGRATGAEAAPFVRSLRDRVDAVRAATNERPAVPMLALEWADPAFTGGHWIPQMVEIAGGTDVLGVAGAPSRTCSWAEVERAAPEAIVFMPCGFGLGDALDQSEALWHIREFASTPAARQGNVWAVDGSAYFSRPGPRLVDGLEILAWILHPERIEQPAAGVAPIRPR